MIRNNSLIITLLLTFIFSTSYIFAQDLSTSTDNSELKPEDKLVVLWTSGDREVALKMVFMYTFNSPRFEWWEDVTLLIWGPSSKLLSEDTELQEYVAKMKEAGIHLKACKACADQYGVSEKLESLGVNVKYMGGELTEFIKEGRHILSL